MIDLGIFVIYDAPFVSRYRRAVDSDFYHCIHFVFGMGNRMIETLFEWLDRIPNYQLKCLVWGVVVMTIGIIIALLIVGLFLLLVYSHTAFGVCTAIMFLLFAWVLGHVALG